MAADDLITIDEFVFYTSPRYYRLVFPDLKPKTKNGDLVAALNELRKWGFLTEDSSWDKIRLDSKGKKWKKLIKKLLDHGALNVPQSNGLFDYRSETGRKALLELIRFFYAKFNFTSYFRYLNLPVLAPEIDDLELFGEGNSFDYRTAEGQESLLDFLKKKTKRRTKKTSNTINKKFFESQIDFPVRVIKKYIKEKGLKRPTPLLNHLNLVEPRIFEVHGRTFTILLPELKEIFDVLEEYVAEFQKQDNAFVNDYFNILNLPTDFFGFQVSGEFNFASDQINLELDDPDQREQVSTFLNVAIEGPKLFASQYSAFDALGELNLIIFPINEAQSIVISCTDFLLFYFTMPTPDCTFNCALSPVAFPAFFVTSTKRSQFGKIQMHNTLVDIDETPAAASSSKSGAKSDSKSGSGSRRRRKNKGEKGEPAEAQETARVVLKDPLVEHEEMLARLSYCSASLYSICQMIGEKFTPEFNALSVFCLYENGYISLSELSESNSLLTSIVSNTELELGGEVDKLLTKFRNSVRNLFDVQKL